MRSSVDQPGICIIESKLGELHEILYKALPLLWASFEKKEWKNMVKEKQEKHKNTLQ